MLQCLIRDNGAPRAKIFMAENIKNLTPSRGGRGARVRALSRRTMPAMTSREAMACHEGCTASVWAKLRGGLRALRWHWSFAFILDSKVHAPQVRGCMVGLGVGAAAARPRCASRGEVGHKNLHGPMLIVGLLSARGRSIRALFFLLANAAQAYTLSVVSFVNVVQNWLPTYIYF